MGQQYRRRAFFFLPALATVGAASAAPATAAAVGSTAAAVGAGAGLASNIVGAADKSGKRKKTTQALGTIGGISGSFAQVHDVIDKIVRAQAGINFTPQGPLVGGA